MEVLDQGWQLTPVDNTILTAQHDGSRSSWRAVSNHHYGLSSMKIPALSCRGQTVDFASTQTIWQGVKTVTRHNCSYDSSRDLPTKAFESSTLLATPIPRDPVPHNSTRDSHCAREPQKLLSSHSPPPPPSHYYSSDEQNTNNKMTKMSPSSSSSSSTPRSRSIKIERTKRSEPDFEADTIDRNTTLYDLASWRMYNRITEYRRQHPINYDDSDMGYAGSSMQRKSPMFLPRKESSTLYGPRALNRVLMSVGPVTSREQHKLDGEVFDMEL